MLLVTGVHLRTPYATVHSKWQSTWSFLNELLNKTWTILFWIYKDILTSVGHHSLTLVKLQGVYIVINGCNHWLMSVITLIFFFRHRKYFQIDSYRDGNNIGFFFLWSFNVSTWSFFNPNIEMQL